MTFCIVWASSAARAFRKLPNDTQRRIAARVSALAADPTPPDAKSLQGAARGLTRIRVADYRVVYQIRRAEVVVLIVAVGHRRDVYERL